MNIRLTDAHIDKEIKIISIEGGRGLKDKLTEMGLVPGEVVRKKEHLKNGPVILEVKGTRLAIGRAMADKITVDERVGKKSITIALAGNPNSGKSSIFNNLTGARQHVGTTQALLLKKKKVLHITGIMLSM